MTETCISFVGGPIFDGFRLYPDHCLTLRNGLVESLNPASAARVGESVDLEGDLLCPGLVDLQVNGGGGLLFNQAPHVDTLRKMTAAHRSLGAAAILPTLITDRPEKTTAAIAAVADALEQAVEGVAGLHLEGPHLSIARKGAHDGDLVRAMTDADLAELVHAARRLPALMLTVAPESVTAAQVATLAEAGAVVSLGHTNADYATCVHFSQAGARCATHLFNAMRQLGSREPGLVGAALSQGSLSAGVIADGIHVHPASLRAAWHAKCAPGALFLVSDAMACAGSDITEFTLGGRLIQRDRGRLTLADGTLAGADLSLPQALSVLVNEVGISLPTALAAATSVPADLMQLGGGHGQFAVGQPARAMRLSPDLRFNGWV
ncbi:MAG: N-acetylglucosamine-6-phosphate deacetylase [Pseudomonadota bacterium]